MNSRLDNNLNRIIDNQELDEISDAIGDGQYSWACVLMLRSAGHDPLHYIPYRTYNRLMKQHGDDKEISSD